MANGKTPPPGEGLEQKLNELLTKVSFAKLVDFLIGRSSAERKALAEPARKHLRQSGFRRRPAGTAATATGGNFVPEVWHAAQLAVFATNPFSTISGVRWEGGDRFSNWGEWRKQLYRLAGEIRPDWLDAWAELLLKQNIDNWAFVRRMIRDSYCRKPAGEEYTLGMMREIRWRFGSHVPDGKGGKIKELPSVQAALLADPDLLEEDVWRIFEIEGNSDCNLQALEPVNHGSPAAREASLSDPSVYSWRYALVDMAKAGRLPRERLLDASLAALGRGFSAARAGWFARLHDELKPTVAERAARTSAYLGLLSAPNPNTVTFAFETLRALDDDRPQDVAALAKHLGPVFSLKSKATIKAALGWLNQLAKRQTKQQAALCRLAAGALLHEAVDVQATGLKFLEGTGDAGDSELRKQVESALDGLSATLKPRAEKWLGLARKVTAPDAKTAAAVVRDDQPAPEPSKPPAAAIQPIASLDELLDRAAYGLAHPLEFVEIERVMDGLLRLGNSRPPDFEKLIGPLRQQVAKWRPANTMVVAENGVWYRQLLRSWTHGAEGVAALETGLERRPKERSRMVWLRALLVARRTQAGGIALPLLSLPSRQGWWITPSELVQRLQKWEAAGVLVDGIDFAIALLRLAPEDRAIARQAAKGLTSEAGLALRYALRDDQVAIGPTSALWAPASRARDPFGSDAKLDARHPRLGPDATGATAYSWSVTKDKGWEYLKIQRSPASPKSFDPNLLPVALHEEIDPVWYQPEFSSDGSALWLLTFWPHCREPLFASAACWLANSFNETFSTGSGIVARSVFDHLAEQPGVGRAMAVLVLALGLMCKDNTARQHAGDALITLIQEKRAETQRLAETLTQLFETPFSAPSRLAQVLEGVGRVSAGHARQVAGITEGLMRGDPAKAQRDVGKLLLLWRELQARHNLPVTDPVAREYVAGLKSGQAAKLAAQLLSHSA